MRRNIIATIINRARRGKPDNWQATVRVGGVSRSKTFENRDDAEKFAHALETEVRKDSKRKSKANASARAKEPTLFDYRNTTLKQTLSLYRDSPEFDKRHRSNIATLLKHIDDLPIGEISPKWVKFHINRFSKTKAPGKKTNYTYATIAAHLATMSIACQWRAEQLELPPQPSFFSTKHFPSQWENCRTRRLSKDEQERLEKRLASIEWDSREHWISLFHLALETGARLQELVGARRDEVQLDRRIWTIPAVRTKSKKERVVPLSKTALHHFEKLSSDIPAGSDRFFHRLGKPSSVSIGFGRYASLAGLVDFKFHDLRHEAISRMVLYRRQLSVFEIMAIVGHSSMQMLMRYANLRGEELVARMD